VKWASQARLEIGHRWRADEPAGVLPRLLTSGADRLRQRVANAKIIGFPRGAGTLSNAYVDSVDVDAVGLDWMIDRGFGHNEIRRRWPAPVNLDPRWHCSSVVLRLIQDS
jgi:hypothetical protein